MTSVDGLTLTALNHAVDEAMGVEKACEYSGHEDYGSGPAVMYGVQVPVKYCGCHGRVIPFCAGCLASLQRGSAEGRGQVCPRCGRRDDSPALASFIRWEPIR